MAAQGQVGGAEIKHHGRLQPLGQGGGPQQLPATPLALGAGRPVPQGLAMAAHQLGRLLGVTALGGKTMDFGEGFCEL